jgi:hypothetical protein
MNATDNTISLQYNTLKNKGFLILDEVFKNNGWQLVNNEMNSISYSKSGDETSFFDIKILNDKISVSIPIKNSIYQFVTTFNNYYEASEYVEQRLLDYIN